MNIHLLAGFLGSGKTTAIQQAVYALQARGNKVAVIANDQGAQLVDGAFFNKLKIPSREVINGCFCCNYADLDNHIVSLIHEGVDNIFAESVGSCTDIIATVFKPMLQFHPEACITVSTFTDVRLLEMMLNGRSVFDETIRYIYLKQLEEASMVILNKADLVTADQLQAVMQLVEKKYPGKILICQNSLNKENIGEWLAVLDGHSLPATPASLNIDYDMYAEGEARMGWLDQLLEIYSTDQNALAQAEKLINILYKKVLLCQYPIGHLKFFVNERWKISLTTTGEQDVVLEKPPVSTASIMINIRLQALPNEIKILVAEAIDEIKCGFDGQVVELRQAAFQPGYPKPAYRFD